MRNYLFLAFGVFFLFVSCKNDNEKNVQTTSRERDSLLIALQERETAVSEFINSFNEVEKNLDAVRVKQNLISATSDKNNDLNSDQKARINNEIQAINALMETNTKALKQLKEQLKGSRSKNKDLEKTVVLLNDQLNYRYNELVYLNNKLFQMNLNIEELHIAMDTLYVMNEEQAQVIDSKEAELRVAYYIIGSSNDFQKWNLIDKEGGFLGIGQSSKMSNNVDLNMFTKIDYLQTTSIPIEGRRVRIITTHPTGSFSLVKTGNVVNSIMINDPKLFWSISKYLVVTNR